MDQFCSLAIKGQGKDWSTVTKKRRNGGGSITTIRPCDFDTGGVGALMGNFGERSKRKGEKRKVLKGTRRGGPGRPCNIPVKLTKVKGTYGD